VSSGTVVSTPLTALEETQIHRVLEQLDLVRNALDAERFAALFAEEADFTVVWRLQTSGRNGPPRTAIGHGGDRV
jgi:hypothetical protein